MSAEINDHLADFICTQGKSETSSQYKYLDNDAAFSVI
jgi:hypothetical protein